MDIVQELKYVCICNGCHRVYLYKAADSSSFGTKNLLDQVRKCSGKPDTMQLKLLQCMRQAPQIAANDIAVVKQKEVIYCVDGHRSFRSVKQKGLRNLLQTCVDLGAKYGKIDISDVLAGRKAVSWETAQLAARVKTELQKVDAGTDRRRNRVSLCRFIHG